MQITLPPNLLYPPLTHTDHHPPRNFSGLVFLREHFVLAQFTFLLRLCNMWKVHTFGSVQTSVIFFAQCKGVTQQSSLSCVRKIYYLLFRWKFPNFVKMIIWSLDGVCLLSLNFELWWALTCILFLQQRLDPFLEIDIRVVELCKASRYFRMTVTFSPTWWDDYQHEKHWFLFSFVIGQPLWSRLFCQLSYKLEDFFHSVDCRFGWHIMGKLKDFKVFLYSW
jgi:hypothetical protein